jgi:small-conductance mechanosensitive channel
MPFTMSSLVALALPGSIILAALAVGLLVRRSIVKHLARAAAGTRSQMDDLLIQAADAGLPLWSAVLGVYVALQFSDLAPVPRTIAERVLVVLVILSITWTLGRLGSDLVRVGVRSAPGGIRSVNLVANLIRVLVFLLGTLVILDTFGISITPLITAFGIGGLAIGLALQDTLANLFAGIHILLARQVRPGDYVRLESGQEGNIHDIAWRYTTIREPSNDLIIVPNARLASAITANFNLPESEQGFIVQLVVRQGVDLEQLERITSEVGREVMREVADGVPQFTPEIRYHTLGEANVQFAVTLHAREYTSQFLLKHEFIKRLYARYQREGIQIPPPAKPT